jgi:hypothetical protein
MLSMGAIIDAHDVRLVRRTIAWMLVSVLVMGTLTLGVDVTLVVSRVHLRPHTRSAGVADGVALASIISLLGAPLLSGLETVCLRIATGAARWRPWWPVPIALTAAITALIVSGLSLYGRRGANLIVVAGFAGTVTAVAIAAHDRRRFVAVAVPTAILVGAIGADIRFAWLRAAHQDLLVIVAACALHGLATPLRRRIRDARASSLYAATAAIVVSCGVVRLPAEDALSRWRHRSDELGRFQPALRRALRALWDVDFDGYSPVFGGGDCDDTNSARNPRARETPNGLDNNCNGVTLPLSPTFADRGLAPPAGTPVPLAGALDLLLLVSIDCMRADALGPETTPNLWRFAARGARMTGMHSAGSKTIDSLPFLQQPDPSVQPIAARFGRMGITSTAVVAIALGAQEILLGFDRKVAPETNGERWTAPVVTDLALADLDQRRGPHYLWVHYYDAHDPIESRASDVNRGPIPGAYLREIGVIDRELGRVIDALDRRGDLAHAAVIVTADHGEAFGAHGIPFHAGTPYEPLIHVPAIFVAPRIQPGRYDGLVSHRDIPLTAMAAFGIDVAGGELFGRSWFRLQDARDAPLHTFVVSSGSSSGMSEKLEWVIGAIVEPHRKVIERYDMRYFVLFDPIADPDEDNDLADAEPDTTARLRRELAIFRDLNPPR